MKTTCFLLMLAVGCLSACGIDDNFDEAIQITEQKLGSRYPMGFARVTETGDTVATFNSTGGTISVSRESMGRYLVEFMGLSGGDPIFAISDARGGNVQVAAEGESAVRCNPLGWYGGRPNWPTVRSTVQCYDPNGDPADSAFAILYFHYQFPSQNTSPTSAAYAMVNSNGTLDIFYDYNSSGKHNSIMKTGVGAYTVLITQAASANASVMVSAIGSDMCWVKNWYTNVAYIRCANRNGSPVDSAFSFAYSHTGPVAEQQGAHTWFNGTSTVSSYTRAVRRRSCAPDVTVQGDSMLSTATISLSGEIGEIDYDNIPFSRASFVSRYGTGGYCKAESLTNLEGFYSTSYTTVNCYSTAGVLLSSVGPFTFTQVTSQTWSEC